MTALMQIIALGLIAALRGSVPMGFDSSLVTALALLVFALTAERVYSTSSSFAGSFPTPLRADVLFLGFYCVVFLVPYWQATDDFTVLSENKFIRDLFLEWSNQAVFLATVCAVAFWLGARAEDRTSREWGLILRLQHGVDKETLVSHCLHAFSAGLLIAIILLVLTGSYSVMLGDYTGLGAGDATSDGIYFLVTQFSMCCAAFTVVALRRGLRPGLLWPTQAVVFMWALALLASGDRNNFLLIAMVYLVGLCSFLLRVRLPVLIGVACAGWLVYQAVEVTRASGARSIGEFLTALSSVEIQDEKFSESSVSLTTATVRAAIDIDPNASPQYYGWFKLVGFLGIVPYARRLLPVPVDGHYTSAQVITEKILGQNPTWSLGSNLVSDVVLDFGVYGAIFVFYLLGRFSTSLVGATRVSDSPVSEALYLIVCALFFQMPRYSLDFPVRNIAWLLVGVMLVRFYDVTLGRRKK